MKLGHLEGKLVLVEWVDATSDDNEWMPRGEALEQSTQDVVISTVGWFLGRRRGQLVLAGQLNDHEDQVGSLRTIPQGCVRRVAGLEEASRPALRPLQDEDGYFHREGCTWFHGPRGRPADGVGLCSCRPWDVPTRPDPGTTERRPRGSRR